MQNSLNKTPGSDPRLELALSWLPGQPVRQPCTVRAMTGDASFRRYFRVTAADRCYVLMDAPPDKEDCYPFLDVARRLRAADLHAPEVIAFDEALGLVLLEDLGDNLLRDQLNTNNADAWFTQCFGLLDGFAKRIETGGLPDYDRQRLLTELELFPAWYLKRHKGIELSCEDWDVWEDLCTRLINSALAQPQVFVHRDFHSCNLMVLADASLAVIDFQDAVRGPISYDLASLLWDRYISWPRSRLEGWMEDFRLRVAPATDPAHWQRSCDWMSLQRNLKIVGIFARLHYRDGKAGYLEMIPQFWRYLREVLPRYPETAAFDAWLEQLNCAP